MPLKMGFLKILHKEGNVVPVAEPIAIIETEEEGNYMDVSKK